MFDSRQSTRGGPPWCAQIVGHISLRTKSYFATETVASCASDGARSDACESMCEMGGGNVGDMFEVGSHAPAKSSWNEYSSTGPCHGQNHPQSCDSQVCCFQHHWVYDCGVRMVHESRVDSSMQSASPVLHFRSSLPQSSDPRTTGTRHLPASSLAMG